MKTICCVDLDGTLLLTDSLLESVLLLIRKNPLMLFAMLVWLFYGRAFFKSSLAQRVELAPDTLPYNREVIQWIQQQRLKGHSVYLVTAANKKVAQGVADYLKLFDGVLASDEHNNLKGIRKAVACVNAFGEKNFIYVGDDSVDLPVWKYAQAVVCVSHDQKLIEMCRQISLDVTVLSKPKARLKDYLKTVRVHQYVKNVLIFVPIFLDGIFRHIDLWGTMILGFFAFCATCSAVYLVNDLYDLNADRQHSRKKYRAFASGLIPLQRGFVLSLGFLLLSIVIQLILENLHFTLLLISYFVLAMAYSQRLKEIAILDVIILTVLFTLRILGGMLFIHQAISNWFLTFSIFFFLSLSFMKRYIELQGLRSVRKQSMLRRAYHIKHNSFVKMNGILCGGLSILVFLLYIASERGLAVYAYPTLLYFVAFILFYWLERMWFLAIEDKVHHDPVLFAVKDRVSYILGAISVMLFVAAHGGVSFS